MSMHHALWMRSQPQLRLLISNKALLCAVDFARMIRIQGGRAFRSTQERNAPGSCGPSVAVYHPALAGNLSLACCNRRCRARETLAQVLSEAVGGGPTACNLLLDSNAHELYHFPHMSSALARFQVEVPTRPAVRHSWSRKGYAVVAPLTYDHCRRVIRVLRSRGVFALYRPHKLAGPRTNYSVNACLSASR